MIKGNLRTKSISMYSLKKAQQKQGYGKKLKR